MLAVVSVSPYSVKCMMRKQMNPDKIEIMLLRALSKLFPKLSFIYFFSSVFLNPWIIFLKAISQPYSFINFTPSMISVHIFTLWSLKTFTYLRIWPLIFPTYNWRGTKQIVIMIGMMPGHPNLRTKMMITPIKRSGLTIEEKKNGAFISMMLKSFDIMLVILPSSWDFTVYWDKVVSFLNRTANKHDLTFPTRIIIS